MVPGSTLMYGSSLTIATLSPRASRIAPSDAEAMPLPSEDTTPPVTNTKQVIAEPPSPPKQEEFRKKIGRAKAGRSCQLRRSLAPLAANFRREIKIPEGAGSLNELS